MNWTTLEIEPNVSFTCNTENEEPVVYVTKAHTPGVSNSDYWVVAIESKYFCLEKKFSTENEAHIFAKNLILCGVKA